MKKRLWAAAIAATAILVSAPAGAGAGECAGAGCVNECPLAQQANQRRSYGEEAAVASARMRQEQVRVVLKNLSAL
jgi:hypothetical protein